MVIDQGRNTAIRVVLGVVRALMFILFKVEVNTLIGQSQLDQDKNDFPKDTTLTP